MTLADYPFKTLPYEHQLSSLRRSLYRHEYAYFLEMGLGKSKVLLDNAAILFDEGKIVSLGTNKYQNPQDRMKENLELYPFVKTKARKTIIEPIIEKRLAEASEQKRLNDE